MTSFNRAQHKICKALHKTGGLTAEQLIEALRNPQDIGEAWAIAHLHEAKAEGYIGKKKGSNNWYLKDKGIAVAHWKGTYVNIRKSTRHEDLIDRQYLPKKLWAKGDDEKLEVLTKLNATPEDIAIIMRRSVASVRTQISKVKNNWEAKPQEKKKHTFDWRGLGEGVLSEEVPPEAMQIDEPPTGNIIQEEPVQEIVKPPEEEVLPLIIQYKGHTYSLIK